MSEKFDEFKFVHFRVHESLAITNVLADWSIHSMHLKLYFCACNKSSFICPPPCPGRRTRKNHLRRKFNFSEVGMIFLDPFSIFDMVSQGGLFFYPPLGAITQFLPKVPVFKCQKVALWMRKKNWRPFLMPTSPQKWWITCLYYAFTTFECG